MSQPELPGDPPLDLDTPVDQIEVIQVMLREVERKIDELKLHKDVGGLLWLTLQTLQNQLELLDQ